MRRALRLIAALGLLLAGLMIGPAGAVAAPVAAVPEFCPSATTYPPSPGATVMASTTTPFVGQVIKVTGKGYCPNEAVEIYIGSKHVGTAHTNAGGAFVGPSVRVPGPVGEATLLGRGASGLSADRDTLVLNIRDSATTPSSGPGLAVTGTEVLALILLAAVLLGGGGVMLYAGRRKRSVRV